jgi:hypothetical protein
MSKKRNKNSKRNNKRNSGQASQLPYAARIIQAWELREAAERAVDAIECDDLSNLSPEAKRLDDIYVERAVKFDELIIRAWNSGNFQRTIAAVKDINWQSMNAGRTTPNSLIKMMDDTSNAHHNRWLEGEDDLKNKAPVRSVVFGIPVSGTLDGALELSQSELTGFLRKTGWAPTLSNVACLGALTASNAIALSQDPLSVWELSDSVLKTKSSTVGGERVHGLMRLSTGNEKRNADPGVVMTGGYVLLMTALSVGEQEFAAIDFPDDPEMMEQRWGDVCAPLIKNMGNIASIDTPCSLDVAGRTAFSLQLLLTLGLARAAEPGSEESPRCIEVAFLLKAPSEPIDMIGIFDDGTQIRISNALPPEGLWLLDDIVENMSDDLDVCVLDADKPLPWGEPRAAATAEAKESSILPFRPRKLH